MPAVFATWLVSLGVSTIGASLITTAVGIGISYGVGKLVQPKGPKASKSKLEVRQSDADRIRWVGKNRVSGVVMYQAMHDKDMYKLIAVSHLGFNSLAQWYWGSEKITMSLSDATLADSRDGNMRLHWRSGIGSEINGGLHPALLAATTKWTNNHRLYGVGTFLAQLKSVKQKNVQEIWPDGERNLSAVIQGGSVTHPNGVSFGPSENLARQLYDYITHPEFGGNDTADMDLASWQQAITDCDDPLPTAGGTRPRYHGGGGYSPAEGAADVVERWLEGMAGQIYINSDGKIAVRVGKWRNPNYTIEREHIVSMEYGVGDRDQLDGIGSILPKYVAPEIDYQETTAEQWDDAAALAKWGETAAKELELPVVQHHGQARALAKIKIAKLNPKWRFTMRLRFWGLLLIDEESVYVNLPDIGIINEPFWIDSYNFDPMAQDGVCTVTLIHANEASFNWTAAEEGAAPSLGGDEEEGPVYAPPVIDCVNVVTDDGAPYITVCTVPNDDALVVIGQSRRSDAAASDPWVNMVGTSATDLRSLSLRDAQSYDVRVAGAHERGYDPKTAWVVVEDIDVIVNTTPPDPPVVVSSSGAAGGTLSVTFEPDLGINYKLTRLYRAAPGETFTQATVVGTTISTAQQITITNAIPAAGARYWLQSENESGAKSTQVYVGEFL